VTSTSNGNVSGNSEDRRRRRQWLVFTFRADSDVRNRFGHDIPCDFGTGVPACRCYRCGTLLTVDTVTVDRIIPGILGGTYRRNNIRPACGPRNFKTGGKLGSSRVKAKR
jgi:hypothetical protein